MGCLREREREKLRLEAPDGTESLQAGKRYKAGARERDEAEKVHFGVTWSSFAAGYHGNITSAYCLVGKSTTGCMEVTSFGRTTREKAS